MRDLCCPGKHGTIRKPTAFHLFKLCKMHFSEPIKCFIFYEEMHKVIFLSLSFEQLHLCLLLKCFDIACVSSVKSFILCIGV